MKTKLPFSTISYNTEPYLKSQLDLMIESKILAFYCYIHHEPDIDDRKEHIHLVLIPRQQLDKHEILEHLKEFDPLMPSLPRGCIPNLFENRGCNLQNWVLYGLHDEIYLRSKGQTRNIHYKKENFIYSDSYQFENLFFNAVNGEYDLRMTLQNAFFNGETFPLDSVPVNLILQAQKYWQALLDRSNVTAEAEHKHDAEMIK